MLEITLLGIALILVALAGLMAAVDAAIGVKSGSDLQELARSSRSQKPLSAIAQTPGSHLDAVNFVRILAETTAAVLVTLAFTGMSSSMWLSLVLSALLMTVVSFVLVGASPRSFGRNNADAILRLCAPLVRVVRILLGPLAQLLVVIGNRVTPGIPREVSFSSEEQLLSMVDEAAERSVLEEDDRELIHSIFEFNDTYVRTVMVPRTDMVTVSKEMSVASAQGLFLSTGISRAPVVADDIDEVLGILYLKDLARIIYEGNPEAQQSPVEPLAKTALFVPESKKADSLLKQMRHEANHLAMVVDEYGGIAGLVTLEDLIEELVGDINDEYDQDLLEYETIDDDGYRVSSRLPLGDLGDLFDLDIADDDVDSAGGLLTKALGRLPRPGDRVSVAGLELTAERTQGRRGEISTIIARRVSSDDAPPAERNDT